MFITKIQSLPRISSTLRYVSTGGLLRKPEDVGALSTTIPLHNVQGLSCAVVDVPDTPVGPGASKDTDYKNPEYFCYHQESFIQAEVEMLKYRCPQPTNKT